MRKITARQRLLCTNKVKLINNLTSKRSRAADPIILDLATHILKGTLTQTVEMELQRKLNAVLNKILMGARQVGIDLARERMKLVLAAAKKLEKKSMSQEEMLQRQVQLAKEQAANGVKHVFKTTKTKIKKAIEMAMGDEEGFTHRELNSQLYDLGLTDKNGDLLEGYRIDRIVRTETHAIASQVEHENVEQMAEDVGVVMVKIWSSAAFSVRTRPTHVEADGQVRDMDKPFNVGDAELMFPGDPAARDTHPEEVINCRCNLLYEQKHG